MQAFTQIRLIAKRYRILNGTQIMSRYFIIIIPILLALSCQPKKQWGYSDFFEQAFSIIEERSIKKNEIDWEVLKDKVTDSIGHFQSNEDVYRALGYTIKLIDDGHSIFIDAHTSSVLTADTLIVPDIVMKIVDEDIGFIKLTGFIASVDNSRIYSRQIRESLYELDQSSNVTGWIIDLRENIGGLSSMMPLGLAPMFQDSLIGYRVNNKGEYISEYCSNEYYRIGNMMVEKNTDLNFSMVNKNKPIAVLISDKTASAGETLASSFKFQNNVKTFGTPTKGLTTALELIEFKSDAKLLLASLYLCGSDKEIIYSNIIPDIECNSEEAFEFAKNWIKNSL